MEDSKTFETEFIEKEASTVLENGFQDAETLLKDEDKFEKFLQKL